MILSEEDARTKWCPFTKTTSNQDRGNRDVNDANEFNCLASGCMCWVWKEDHTKGVCGLIASGGILGWF